MPRLTNRSFQYQLARFDVEPVWRRGAFPIMVCRVFLMICVVNAVFVCLQKTNIYYFFYNNKKI